MAVNLVNETPLAAAWTVGFQRDGRETVIVVAKGTYVLVGAPGEPAFAEQQVPIFKADEFGPDPAWTATRFESDFAHMRPSCDVLLHGQAHAPQGRPVRSLIARLRVGDVHKSMRVTGPRAWTKSATTGLVPSHPVPYSSQPISYDGAFGGMDKDPEDELRVATFLDNPVGLGFRQFNLDVDGQPMAWIEEVDRPIKDLRGPYRPMSFGPVGRSWRQRARFAGTYDQEWLDRRAPLWPNDFNELYFQASPEDQQMGYARGGEIIELENLVPITLSPDARARAQVPRRPVGAVFIPWKGSPSLVRANLDTIVIEPDANRFSCTWRVVQPMVRDVFDVREVILGDPDAGLVGQARAKAAGKQYVPGLDKLPPRKPRRP